MIYGIIPYFFHGFYRNVLLDKIIVCASIRCQSSTHCARLIYLCLSRKYYLKQPIESDEPLSDQEPAAIPEVVASCFYRLSP